MQLKKWLCTVLVLGLLLSMMPTAAMAATQGHGELTGRQEGQMSISLEAASVDASGPALASGSHERWIDRIDQLPDYATDFYAWLETDVQSSGALCDPTQLTPIRGDSGAYDTYAYCFHSIKGSASFSYTGTGHKAAAETAVVADIGNTHNIAIQYATAVFGAFDRDHPEVFWLTGNTLYGYNAPYDYNYNWISKTGTVTYTLELYFILQTPDYDIRNPGYQTPQAIAADIENQSNAVKAILQDCPQDSVYEQLRYLNSTLTKINAYNSAVALGNMDDASPNAWKGISALTGNYGLEGPVCEGYARALMILCRELGIPCVLCQGEARTTPTGATGAHMWNYVQLEDVWYAVDTTWNDPYISTNGDAVISGYESDQWLLTGSETVVMGMTFDTSHILTNQSTVNSLMYTNGPELTENAYVPPVVITVPTLTLKAPTLEFKDTVKVIAFFTADNIEDVVEMGMVTYSSNVEAVDVSTAEHLIPGAIYEEGSGRYFASSQGINAKYLGDTVYLACYAKLTDGSYVYTKLAPYSPIQYAASQLKNSADMNLKQLVVAMLNYGTAAQNYFGYNTDAPANANLTAEQLALPETYFDGMVSTVPAADAAKQGTFANNQGFSVRKPAVSFEGAFSINYFFTPAYAPVDGVTLYYWTEADFNAADVLTAQNASGSLAMTAEASGQYRGDITEIAAKNLAQAIYVAAVYSDGTAEWTSGVLGYSIGAYCASMAKGTDTMADLAKATAVYGYHAKQYFG